MDSAKIEHGREIWQRLPAHFNLWPLIQAGIISLPSWEINYEELADWFDARAEKEKENATRPRKSNRPDTSLPHYWGRRFIDMVMGLLM